MISSNNLSLSPHHKKDDLIMVSHQKQRKKLSVALPITSENPYKKERTDASDPPRTTL